MKHLFQIEPFFDLFKIVLSPRCENLLSWLSLIINFSGSKISEYFFNNSDILFMTSKFQILKKI
jgi:hypothetical protein